LLTQTKGKEAEYQRQLADKKKQAQEIRSRIFELIGVPDAPTFGEAVEIAKGASAQTGVRPALLLAVLTQESNLGKNVGQCYVKNTATGEGVSVRGASYRNVMKPNRDVQPFLQITRELGRDPLQTPVSCPIPSVGGYGGAMGPAQFIPSTWMLFKPRLDGILGRSADPWNIKDAFLASALYLGDSGAAAQTYDAEWCAAQKYFSGRCSTRYRFYGDSVMNLAARYERDIQTLEEGS
jgi:membrane-bound lytic murein transglycosylase B